MFFLCVAVVQPKEKILNHELQRKKKKGVSFFSVRFMLVTCYFTELIPHLKFSVQVGRRDKDKLVHTIVDKIQAHLKQHGKGYRLRIVSFGDIVRRQSTLLYIGGNVYEDALDSTAKALPKIQLIATLIDDGTQARVASKPGRGMSKRRVPSSKAPSKRRVPSSKRRAPTSKPASKPGELGIEYYGRNRVPPLPGSDLTKGRLPGLRRPT